MVGERDPDVVDDGAGRRVEPVERPGRIDRPHHAAGQDWGTGVGNRGTLPGDSEARRRRIDVERDQLGAAGDVDVGRGPRGAAKRRISGHSGAGRARERCIADVTHAGGVEDVAGAALANLEDAIVGQQRRADRADVGVAGVQARPVRGRPPVDEAKGRGQLEDRLTEVEGIAGAATGRVAGGDVDIP